MLLKYMTKISIEVKTGNITHQNVDLLINSSNTYLLLGSGTAEQIRKAGGELSKDNEEYRILKHRTSQENPVLGKVLDYIDTTERLPSKAQNMRLRYIIENGSRELELGDAVLFPSRDLSNILGRAKYVSDAIGMTYDWKIQPKPPTVPATFTSVMDSLTKSFYKAAELRCKSIAMPPMCIRKGGLTLEESARASKEALKVLDGTTVERIEVVLYNEELAGEVDKFRKLYEES
jgi:O-acetyl-ADP-ribose deacetylase (regulator of RNase III)